MAAAKAKAGVTCDTARDGKPGSPTEPAPNHRLYSLDQLETVATVGEFTGPDRARASGPGLEVHVEKGYRSDRWMSHWKRKT